MRFLFSLQVNNKKIFKNFVKFFFSFTVEGQFGRIESVFTISMSNMFPLWNFHQVFLTRKHDILNVEYEEFLDWFSTPMKWF